MVPRFVISYDTALLVPWVEDRVDGRLLPDAAIGQVVDGEVVAGVVYDNYTGTVISAHIAVDPGASLTREFLWAICTYPFEQLKVNKLYGFVKSTNIRSLDFCDRMGFVEEFRLVGYYPDADAVILSCTKESCRWLIHG